MRLADIPIQRKLPLSIGVGLFLFCGVVLLYTLTLSKTIASYERLLDRELAIRQHADQVAIQILQARRDEKDFLARKDPELARGVAERVQSAIQSAREVERLAPETARAQEILHQLRLIDLLETYAARFQSVARAWEERGMDHDHGQQKHFRDAAHAMEETFLDLGADDSLADLEYLLRLTMTAWLTGDPEIATRVATLTRSLQQTLSATPDPSDLEKTTLAGLQAFATAREAAKTTGTPARSTTADWMDAPGYQPLLQLTTQVRQQTVPGARTIYLTMRRLEKDYLLRQDATLLPTLHGHANRLATLVVSHATLPETTQSRLQKHLEAYQEALHKLVVLDEQLREGMAAMREAVRATEPLTRQIGLIAQELATRQTVETRQFAEESARFILIICLLTVFGCGLWSFYIVRSIVKALANLWHFSHQVAGGDLEAKTTLDSRDEIGQLAQVMREMVNRMRVTRLIADRMVMIIALASRGAIPEPLEAQFQGDFQKMCDALNEMIRRLRELRIIVNHVDRISRGEIPDKLTGAFQGDFKRMADAVNTIIDQLRVVGALSSVRTMTD